jgi:hypothetical protein
MESRKNFRAEQAFGDVIFAEGSFGAIRRMQQLTAACFNSERLRRSHSLNRKAKHRSGQYIPLALGQHSLALSPEAFILNQLWRLR